MSARAALVAGLFALAAAAAPVAGQPKKAAPKFNAQKVAAAQQALFKAGCRFGFEQDRKSEWFGHVRLVNFSEKTTDADFAKAIPHLQALPALTGLDLGLTKVTDAGTAHLAKLTRLEALYLDRLEITGQTLRAVAELRGLQWLVLHPGGYDPSGGRPGPGSGLVLTPADLEPLGTLHRLRHLEVAFPVGSLEPLRGLTALEHLEANVPTGTADGDLSGLVGATRLRVVHFRGAGGLTGAALAHLTAADLEEITLDSMAVGDVGAKHLAGFPKLTQLELGRPPRAAGQITDEGAKALTALAGLKRLNLSGNPVTFAGVAGTGNWQALEYLDLARSGVTDEGAKALARAPALSVLDLSHTKVGDDGARALAGHPKLTDLRLDGTTVTGVGFAGTTPKLRALHLSNAPVTADGLKAIAASAPALADLNVNDTPADDAGVRAFARSRAIRTIHAVRTQATPAAKGAVERAVPGSVVWLTYPAAERVFVPPAGVPGTRPLRQPTTRTPTSPGRP